MRWVRGSPVLFLGGGGGGLSNERPQTDYVTTGPMRGLEKIAWEGDNHTHNTHTDLALWAELVKIGSLVTVI